ncbi:RidA family protein [Teredinibacter franksiae]|uniref:RidA family protein n=1 Tax=Teredinibacter franksiae TaxID=2761453 RepID=UPI001626E81D|nr:RidA family protein [Teredinibacter franksiae]
MKRVYSGAPWEKQVAYCRAVKFGSQIAVSGTTAVDAEGIVVGENDIYAQTSYIFEKISTALVELGANLSDVVRTRMYVTDMTLFDQVAKAHKEAFDGIDPAATCVEVSRFVDDSLLIEIEVDAYISEK